MKPYRSRGRASFLYSLLLIVVLVNLPLAFSRHRPAAGKTAALPSDARSTALGRSGLDHFYNMEYDKAIHDFELDVQQHPDDPFAASRLLSGVLFKELYRIGALDTEIYASDSFLSSRRFPVDPKVRQRIQELTDNAQAVAERRLQANPADPDALYARGAIRASRATTTGLLDRSWFSALRSAIGARRDHERVLQLDPNYADAKLVVGIDNYVLGSLPLGVKVAASVVGISGSKQKGIRYLYDAAEGGGEASVDAKIALSLFLRREQRYPEAIKLVGQLVSSYPRNFLFALEYANLLAAAGHGPESIAAYRKLLANGREGVYQEPRLDQAAMALGEALRGQNDFQGAVQAFESVPGFARAEPEVVDRANLAAGQMYDLLQRRDLAIRKYQQVISAAGDSPRAAQARKYLKQAYQLPKPG
jgi:tetratricopeptide (TPR) repeat protein